jgi:hypothetical protein
VFAALVAKVPRSGRAALILPDHLFGVFTFRGLDGTAVITAGVVGVMPGMAHLLVLSAGERKRTVRAQRTAR